MLAEIMRLPESNPMSTAPASYVFAFVFLVFMLFVTGGILETYRDDRRLTTGEFFAASGAYFWRFFRLALLSIVPFVIVNLIYQGLDKAADKIGDRAIADQVGIFLSIAAVVIFLLLALWVRLWFDMAQIRAVVLNERGMWRDTWRAWRLTWRNQLLFWRYMAISLVAWIALAIGLLIWAHLPSSTHLLTFLVLEFIVFAYLATRLWQLSSAMTWYLRHPEPVPVVEVVEAPMVPPTPAEPEQIPPPSDPGPELPPADA
jgi:hypothetical protein